VESLIAYISGEWGVISQAPLTFAVGALLIAALVYAIIRQQFADRLESAEGRLKLRDDQIADYREKLQGATPDEARARIDDLEPRIQQVRDDLSPRQLSQTQIDALVEVARRKPGSAFISRDMTCGDGAHLMIGLQNAFRAAGWRVISGFVGGPDTLPPEGLALAANNPDKLTPVEQVVFDALSTAKVPFAVTFGGRVGEGEAELIVTTRLV
jgi:membrane protein implicated in regulation of membrane protease activity